MTVELEGYRRFEEPVRLDVAGDVIALIGPNEAGKSSILSAMLSLNHQAPFSAREQTRGTSGRTSVAASFVLDDSDRAVLQDVPGAEDVRWWTLTKKSDGKRVFSLHPRPTRDLTSRHERAESLKSLAASEWIEQIAEAHDEDILHWYREAEQALSSSAESLTGDELHAIRQFAQAVSDVPVTEGESESKAESESYEPAISRSFRALVDVLAQYDEGSHPHTTAGLTLVDRMPSFILFGPEDRTLRTTYDLEEVIEAVPPALGNLARLARLDLRMVLDASQGANRGLRATLMKNANDELQRVFAEWHQSSVTVHLELQETVLEVLVSLPSGEYTEIEERSDGLLWFVALRAFMAKHDVTVPPILLVDEAETHLHYDAQADLVNLFATQDLAAKVIYTTHSAGCLPRDLGCGIRVVEPLSTSERSTIENSVWHGRKSGFTPLVYALGATTFAFLPVRHVLIAEGVTDAMLYPTLFREATGARGLEFQVAPGLAATGSVQKLGLSSEGGAVLFITDGDAAGERHRQDLMDLGVPEEHIFCLKDTFNEAVELEDLIDPTLYVEVVNDILGTFRRTTARFPVEHVPETGRIAALERWCVAQNLPPPDKTDVAQRLLDKKSEAAREGIGLDILLVTRSSALATLCTEITASFKPAIRSRRRAATKEKVRPKRGMQ